MVFRISDIVCTVQSYELFVVKSIMLRLKALIYINKHIHTHTSEKSHQFLNVMKRGGAVEFDGHYKYTINMCTMLWQLKDPRISYRITNVFIYL